MSCLVTAGQQVNNMRAIARQPPITTIEGLLRAVFAVRSVPRLYSEEPRPAAFSRVEAGSNNSTVVLRVVGGDEKGTQYLGYNWATLFLGGMNTRTWHSRFGESQI
jgi:hypothetical protein